MKKTKGFLLAVAIATMAFTFSCSSDDSEGGGGGGTCSANFKTVTIGTQTWMAENLNCDVKGSKCYNDDPANCAKYGRLYDWTTAMNGSASSTSVPSGVQGVCPKGWHLPSKAEWEVLITAVGGSSTAGSKLKAKNDWNNDGNGTDDHDFSALPGGGGGSSGSFHTAGNYGGWWAASEYEGYHGDANVLEMEYNLEKIGWDSDDKSWLYSVRCVKD